MVTTGNDVRSAIPDVFPFPHESPVSSACCTPMGSPVGSPIRGASTLELTSSTPLTEPFFRYLK